MEVDQDQGTFIVGRSKLEPGQTLAPDLSTYEMLFRAQTSCAAQEHPRASGAAGLSGPT